MSGRDFGAYQPTAPRVFVSYRREDSAGYAGRLYEELADRFGQERVFMDIDSLAPGIDFQTAIEQTLPLCDTVLILIGRAWLNVTGSDGNRRLDNPNDFVRLETERALSSNRRVIPVLVGDAVMPVESELPAPVAALVRRHCVELSDRRWRADTKDLIDAIERGWPGHQESETQLGPSHLVEPRPDESTLWDRNGTVATTLAAIVTIQGASALFDEQSLTELFGKLRPSLPPRESRLVLAASRRHIAQEITESLSHLVGADETVATIAARMYEQEPFDLAACEWVTRAFAEALAGARIPPAEEGSSEAHSDGSFVNPPSEKTGSTDVGTTLNDAHRRRRGHKPTKSLKPRVLVLGLVIILLAGGVLLGIDTSNHHSVSTEFPNVMESALLTHLNVTVAPTCHRYSQLDEWSPAVAGVECPIPGFIDIVYLQFSASDSTWVTWHFDHIYDALAEGSSNNIPAASCRNPGFYDYQKVTRVLGGTSLDGSQVCFPATGIGGDYESNGPELRLAWTSPTLHILAWADGPATDYLTLYRTWESLGGPCPASNTGCLQSGFGTVKTLVSPPPSIPKSIPAMPGMTSMTSAAK